MNFNHHIANAIVPQATSAFSVPIKICDGLFMADHYIAQDTQFFETNLITHVINCAGQEVHNNQKVSGVTFLTFDWTEKLIQNITQQKVVSVTVNFIEECRKQAGCLLINYASSQSRPFCLLACYFMVKFKWSLFKTLQFLNSRKEDVQLQPAFFEQLTAFAQKLQDKGLIRSKTWILSQGMSDEQIIITNTYLNSKNKFPIVQMHPGNRSKNRLSVTWKKELVISHNYCPGSIIQQKQKPIAQKQQKNQRKSLLQPPKNSEKNTVSNSREKREQSIKRNQKQQVKIQSQTQQLQPHKSNLPAQREKPIASASMTQINVTKKWAELRQMWIREKQNQGSNLANKGVAEAANPNYYQEGWPKNQ